MKTLTATLVVTLLLCSIQSNAQSFTDVVGTWVLDFDETIDLMHPTSRAVYDTLGISVQDQVRSQLDNQSFQFNTDSTFQFVANGVTSTGSWYNQGNQLQLTFANGAQAAQTIESLDANRMILRIVQNPNSEALIKQVALIKILN